MRIFNNTFKTYAVEINMSPNRSSVITTDGMPTIMGSTSVFIAHCKKDESFPYVISYRCVIHHEALCVKSISILTCHEYWYKNK